MKLLLFFSVHTVIVRNSLPNYVADVNTVNLFKAYLDKLWFGCTMMSIYDFTHDLTKISDRSVHKMSGL